MQVGVCGFQQGMWVTSSPTATANYHNAWLLACKQLQQEQARGALPNPPAPRPPCPCCLFIE